MIAGIFSLAWGLVDSDKYSQTWEKKIRLYQTPQNHCSIAWYYSTWKSCALNKQFQSVFATEDLSNIPQLDYSVHPSIQNLEFTTHDIQERLQPTEAPDPDQIPTKVINSVLMLLLLYYCLARMAISKGKPKHSCKLSTNFISLSSL